MSIGTKEREITDLITRYGGQLEPPRNGSRHQKYRFPNGRCFIMSSTPSDHRVVHRRLSSLKRFLREAGLAQS